MDKSELTKKLKMKALELGFSKVGITTTDAFADHALELSTRPDYAPWVNKPETGRLIDGCCPKEFYPESKSIICSTYGFGDMLYPEELTPYVGRTYLSRSYSPLEGSSCGIRENAFKEYIKSLGISLYEGNVELPKRMACARAGITTFGKNNFAYTKENGSFIILYTFLVDAELEYDKPTITCDCPPKCQECMKACPTQAIKEERRLLPMNCVLMNNILGSPNSALHEKLGTRIHGCDECQLACPRNKKVIEKMSKKDWFLEELKKDFDLEKILLLDDAYYEDVIRPIMYNYIQDMDIFRRNAAIALGNTGDPSHIPALKMAMGNKNSLVVDAAQGAIDKLEKKILA
ncbi:epoxyqueuosine reductase [Desulfocastanea catecholica]